jgi:hypothetical protein
MDPNEDEEHLLPIDWDHDVTGSWDEEGHYDPDAAPVILPHSLDLVGEA